LLAIGTNQSDLFMPDFFIEFKLGLTFAYNLPTSPFDTLPPLQSKLIVIIEAK
jgi:hypothetical protein